MLILKKKLVSAVIFFLISSPCLAAADSFKDLFLSTVYGSVSGGLIGAAVMVFTKRPSNHLDYIGYGAAGGAIVGAVYGTVRMRSTNSLAEVENGKVKFAIPTVIPDLQEASSSRHAIVVTAELLRGKF